MKAITIVSLALFMATLFGIEMTLHNRLKQASFAQQSFVNNAMVEKSVLEDKLKFSIPEEWEFNEKEKSSEKVIYEAEANTSSKDIILNVSVMNIESDRARFLEKNEELPMEDKYNIKKYYMEKDQILIKMYFKVDKNMNKNLEEKSINSIIKSVKYE